MLRAVYQLLDTLLFLVAVLILLMITEKVPEGRNVEEEDEST